MKRKFRTRERDWGWLVLVIFLTGSILGIAVLLINYYIAIGITNSATVNVTNNVTSTGHPIVTIHVDLTFLIVLLSFVILSGIFLGMAGSEDTDPATGLAVGVVLAGLVIYIVYYFLTHIIVL